MDENQTKQLTSGTLPAPRIKIVEGGFLAPEIDSEEEHDYWHALLAESFGVEDRRLASALLIQVVRGSQDLRKGCAEKANAAIAAVREMQPQGAVEALLTVQMAVLHNQCMQMMAEAARATSPEKKGAYLNLALKLTRAYANSMDSLRKIKQNGHQKMVVEHVHVHNGGQAIVGSLTNVPRGEGSK